MFKVKLILKQRQHRLKSYPLYTCCRMRKALTVFLCFFILMQSFSQTDRKVSACLLVQYNHTLYDYTSGNNPWGIGAGFQAFFNNRSKFKPTVALTGDVYLADDKVLRSNPDGLFPENGNKVGGMINFFAGSSFHPTQSVYVSLVAGPSFIGGKIFVGIKPSFGFYFSKTQRLTGKISYINVFNRTKKVNEDFGSFSVAMGLKLF